MKMRLFPLVILVTLGLALAGVAQAAPKDPGVIAHVQRSDPQDAISPAPFAPLTAADPQSGATATPHPILGDVRVRQAIAFCTDKTGLLASVYPSLTPAQRQALVADTFIRPTSWAYTAPATTYPYVPATGQALLEQAGWTLESGATYRTRGGKQLVLTLRTTDSPFRITFLTVFESQMQACGIRVIREHLDMNWFFGMDTGIQVRDFELSDFAWMIPDSEPGGRTMYVCDQIPAPTNGWKGQNFPGWCNASASTAIATATNTALGQTERKAAYALVINAAATDLPQLPLFWRDNGTGQPSETWEHIDFNLETFSQDAELAPATATTLNTADYAGNAGSVAVPTGAVAQNTTLSYYPLVASAYEPSTGMSIAKPFRLTAAVAGVPQVAFEFSMPVTLIVRYDEAGIRSLREETLNLYRWNEDTGWQPAQESCPEGQRYYHIDRTTNVVEVHICHLSEYALMGATKHIVYLPLVMRNYDPLLYDAFNNPTFDGAYDPTLWSLADGAAGYKGEQQAGALVFSNDPAVTPAWSCANLMMTKPQQRSLAQLQLFEARLRLASDLSGGKASVEMSFQSRKVGTPSHLWATGCWIGATVGSQPSLECNIGGSAGLAYSTGYHDVAYDTWYKIRIETNPVSAELRYYLDGNLIGSHVPSDAADVLQADSFVPRISACTFSTNTSATRYVDDVRVTPAQ